MWSEKIKTCRDFPAGPVVKNLPADAGDMVWSLFQENPTFHGATKPRATTTEVLTSQEKPLQWEAQAPQLKSSPCSLQLEKSLNTATKTQCSQKKKDGEITG